MSFSGTKGYLTKPKPGVMLDPTHPLSQGLVGYWLFNEGAGSLANDISGNKNHGTLTNMSSNAQGSRWGGSKFGGGLDFDGNDDYIEVNANNSYKTANITLSCWVKRKGDSSDRKHTLFFVGYNAGGTAPYSSYSLFYDRGANSELELFLGYTDDTYDSHITTGGTLALNVWQHVVATYDGVRVKIYLDGVIKYNELESKSISYYTLSPDPLLFGDTVVSQDPFNGSTDSACIYNRALSAIEVKQLNHDPFCNLLQVPIRRYSVAPPVGAIMTQFQKANIGADLYNGVLA